MNNLGRNIALWVVVALFLVVLFNVFQPSSTSNNATELAYSNFLTDVSGGNVQDVTISGHDVTGTTKDGKAFETYTPDDPTLVGKLIAAGVHVDAKPQGDNMNPILKILISWAPMLLLIGVWVFFMRQMQSGGGRAMGFGKSRARLLTEKAGPRDV